MMRGTGEPGSKLEAGFRSKLNSEQLATHCLNCIASSPVYIYILIYFFPLVSVALLNITPVYGHFDSHLDTAMFSALL